MRISDWSSDVCSSDLGGRVLGHHRLTARIAGDIGVGDILADDVERRLIGADARRAKAKQVAHSGVPFASSVAAIGCARSRKSAIAFAMPSVPRFAISSEKRASCMSRKVLIASRSEEHTSELQSLMRISYAV